MISMQLSSERCALFLDDYFIYSRIMCNTKALRNLGFGTGKGKLAWSHLFSSGVSFSIHLLFFSLKSRVFKT